jgi:hypothetical protein
VTAPDEPRAQELQPPLVDEEQVALAAVSLKPTIDELLGRLRDGEKIAPEDYAHALLALGVQNQRRGKDNAPVPVEFIRLLAGQILGPKRVATLEERWGEIEEYRRNNPKARASKIAEHFEQPGVRGWSWSRLRRKIKARLQNKTGHSD